MSTRSTLVDRLAQMAEATQSKRRECDLCRELGERHVADAYQDVRLLVDGQPGDEMALCRRHLRSILQLNTMDKVEVF